jgi:hypothetical protein
VGIARDFTAGTALQKIKIGSFIGPQYMIYIKVYISSG